MPILLHFGKTQWASSLKLSCVALMVFLACPVNSMDVLVPPQILTLNGTDVRIPCAFTSCYKLDPSKFAMNWTYQETSNSTEEIFMTYKNKITPLKSTRFGDRVIFSGNLDKNDLSITISNVQLTDEGIYNCYVRNPPDRIRGHGIIQVFVPTECKASVWAKKLYPGYFRIGYDEWCFLIAGVVKSRIRIECCIDDTFLKVAQQKDKFLVAFGLL
uniref:Sodium channel, voltage-gated, type II, beta n=1 Tax=Cyprinus carpio TaxID=7962 RepID=A0A8C1WWM1_CYPCA